MTFALRKEILTIIQNITCETEMKTLNPSLEFINLNNKVLAEYSLLYNINRDLDFNQIEKISDKSYFDFDRFAIKNQYSKLIYIDSSFPKIFADLALNVFTNKITTINQYILLNSKEISTDYNNPIDYFRYKFFNFLDLLLYSDLAEDKLYVDKIHSNRVFCSKKDGEEIRYFTIFEKKELVFHLFENLKLKANYEIPSIKNKSLKISLNFTYSNIFM